VLKALLVGFGGFVGSVGRYWLSGLVQDRLPESFPWGTLAVNVCGCFAIGVLSELAETRSLLTPDTRALLMVGVIGGFTTFSAFGNETMNLIRDRDATLAVANVAAHLVLGLAAVWLGRATTDMVWR
jgi:CrcB protein